MGIDRVQVIKDGKVVMSSQNLAVIGAYYRKGSNFANMTQNCRMLTVKYEDGATVKTTFSDPSVLTNYIEAKSKRFDFPFTIKPC